MKFSKEFAGRYLKAADIQDIQPVTCTITNVDLEEVESRETKERRSLHVLYTDKFEKGIPFKKMMGKVLADAYGDDMDLWEGQPVELVVREQEIRRGVVQRHPLPDPQGPEEGGLMKRTAIPVTSDILAGWIANFTSRVDEPAVLPESIRTTSLPTERLTEIIHMLTDGITVRQAALKLVRQEITRRQGPPSPQQLEFEFE